MLLALILIGCTATARGVPATPVQCEIIRATMAGNPGHHFGPAVGPTPSSPEELDRWPVDIAAMKSRLNSLGGDFTAAEIEHLTEDLRSEGTNGMRIDCDDIQSASQDGYGNTGWVPPVQLRNGEFAYVRYWTQWNGLAGTGDECLLQRSAGAWRILACDSTGVS
jgi:hypothetical protein